MFQSAADRKPGWHGKATRTVSEAVGSVEYQLKKDTSLDIYVCMSSQRVADVRETNGRTWNAAIRSKHNAVHLKSLYVDVDVFTPEKPDKPAYKDTREAFYALHKFCAKINIPKPTAIVRSGSGGLHAYWVLSQKLPVHEWSPLAHALAEATKREGLICDTQCTVDAARILRVPGTYNYKQSPPRPVLAGKILDYDYSVERLWQGLDQYRTVSVVLPALPPKTPLTEESDLAAGIERTSSNIAINSVVTECPFLAEALLTGGKDYANPLWNLTTLTATFLEDGRAQAHAMARGHSTYSVEATDALYDRKERERAEQGLGWPKCTTISASGCNACNTCPHLGAGKSPLNFAHRSVPVVSNVVSLSLTSNGVPGAPNALLVPPEYTQGTDNRIYKQTIADDGTTKDELVCPFQITDVEFKINPFTISFVVPTLNGNITVDVRSEALSEVTAFTKVFSTAGLPLSKSFIPKTMEFFVAWQNHLVNNRRAKEHGSPIGWTTFGDDIDGFAYNGVVYTDHGTRSAPRGDPVILSNYAPRGRLEPWIAAAKFITDQDRADLNAILAASFGAPLVQFTNESGLYMSTYSVDSGIGKSTTIKTGLAVWAHPDKAKKGMTDTIKSLFGAISQARALPAYWDEIRGEVDQTKFVKIAFQLSEGKENTRMRSNLTLVDPGTWKTILISSANDSILDAVIRHAGRSDAGLYRVLEFPVKKWTREVSLAESGPYFMPLERNYGNAGLVYAQWLGANSKKAHDDTRVMITELSDELKAVTAERFWICTIACTLLGATYANELGLTEFNLEKLRAFLLHSVRMMRNDQRHESSDLRQNDNVATMLNQFLNEKRLRHTIMTTHIPRGSGRVQKGTVGIIGDPSRVESVQIQIGRNDRILRFNSHVFSEWCRKNEYPVGVTRRMLKEQFGATQIQGFLGSGTSLANPLKGYFFEIDLNDPRIRSLVDL